MKFYQCDMSRGTTRTHGYLPERAAVVGKRVVLSEPGFEGGAWRVDAVGVPGVEEHTLRARQRFNHQQPFASIEGQRQAS